MPEIVTPLAAVPLAPDCVCVPPPPTKLCIDFPVVGEICTNRTTFNYQSLSGLLLQFTGSLQPLLAPLMPILVLVSLAIALVDCVKAVPKAVSRLSPGPVLDCIDELLKILPKLLAFIPPLNYIALIRTIVFFLITLLQSIIDALDNILDINIDDALAGLPNDQYRCCLNANVDAHINQVLASIEPVAPIFSLVAEVLKILAIPGTEKFIGPIIDAASLLSGATNVEVSEDLINALQAMQNALNAIHTVLGGTLGAVQTVQGCDC